MLSGKYGNIISVNLNLFIVYILCNEQRSLFLGTDESLF